MVPDELQALTRERLGGLGEILQSQRTSMAAAVVEPLQVLSLRALAGGAESLVRAIDAIGIAALPGPGRFAASGATRLVWRNPTEWLLVTPEAEVAQAVLRALAPAQGALACAIDQSDGLVTLELRGAPLDAVLHRLLDAAAVPHEPGQGTRARMADIAVVVLRLDPERAWLIADRANDRYLAHWVAHATDALSALS